MHEKSSKELMTIPEAASYLGLTEAALRKRYFMGDINKHLVMKMGKRIYFVKRRLEKFLENPKKRNLR